MGNRLSQAVTSSTSDSSLIDCKSVTNLNYVNEGNFSKIYQGKWCSRKVAIKVPKVPPRIRKDYRLVKTHIAEIKRLKPIIRNVKSDALIRYIGVGYDEYRKEVWILRDFVDGNDLETLLQQTSLCPPLKLEEKRLKIAIGIANGISTLHSSKYNMIHGDLKPSDILIDAKTLQPKIVNYGLWDVKDFFVRAVLPAEDIFNEYHAPEVVLGEERPSMFSDTWSMGAIILLLLTETPLWDVQELRSRFNRPRGTPRSLICEAMMKGESPTLMEKMSESPHLFEEYQFLQYCIEYDMIERLKADTVEKELRSIYSTNYHLTTFHANIIHSNGDNHQQSTNVRSH